MLENIKNRTTAIQRKSRMPELIKMTQTKKNTDRALSSNPPGIDNDVLTLDKLIVQSGESISKLVSLSNMTRQVWYSRVEKPEKFTIEEIENLTITLNNLERLNRRPEIYTSHMVYDAIKNTIEATKNKPKE